MKGVEKARRPWSRWFLLGVCSCVWIGVHWFFYCAGRGGISFLAGEPRLSVSTRPPGTSDLWAEALIADGNSGWGWMIADPRAMQKSEVPGQAEPLEEKVRSQARESVPSVWFDSVPGLLPLRRKVESDGRVVAELLASTDYRTGAELMQYLVGTGGGTIRAMVSNEWQVIWRGIPLLCQWREATGAVSETKSRQVRGWLLVRPGMEESSRP